MSSDSLQLHRGQSHVNEAEASEMIQKYDKNGDSIITKEEIVDKAVNHKANVVPKAQKVGARAANEKKAPKIKFSRSQIKEIFMEHDIDGDGCLSVSELIKAFSFLGSVIPLYKAHYGLAFADDDGDGLISEEELDKLVDYAEKVCNNKRGF